MNLWLECPRSVLSCSRTEWKQLVPSLSFPIANLNRHDAFGKVPHVRPSAFNIHFAYSPIELKHKQLHALVRETKRGMVHGRRHECKITLSLVGCLPLVRGVAPRCQHVSTNSNAGSSSTRCPRSKEMIPTLRESAACFSSKTRVCDTNVWANSQYLSARCSA